MKTYLILAVMPVLLAACGKSAVVTTTEKVVVETVVAAKPSARKEKKMENLSIIVYPPGTRGTAISHPIPPLPSAHQTMSPAKQQ
ncbi:MAG: hypothetical protein Q8M07_22560 [Prosthecobacter sp.]|nr:hypothetical protein [Prosthecobacter sp.]HBJ87977.1 hypothetical protein [Verrucomicrobiales bacterium]